VVFERLHELEIPYVWRTTARGSPTRDMLNELTGRIQVPYLEDENTGVSMFESADIVDYLNKVYGTSAPGSKSEPTAEERAAANSIGVVGAVETAASVVSAEGGPELDPKPSTGGDPLLEEPGCGRVPYLR
jgi:glutathione S-transferase